MSKTRRKLLKQVDIFYAAGTARFFPQMNNDAQPKPIFCSISKKNHNILSSYIEQAQFHYGFPVMTAQEKELMFNDPINVNISRQNVLEVEYSDKPQEELCRDWSSDFEQNSNFYLENLRHTISKKNLKQLPLF